MPRFCYLLGGVRGEGWRQERRGRGGGGRPRNMQQLSHDSSLDYMIPLAFFVVGGPISETYFAIRGGHVFWPFHSFPLPPSLYVRNQDATHFKKGEITEEP